MVIGHAKPGSRERGATTWSSATCLSMTPIMPHLSGSSTGRGLGMEPDESSVLLIKSLHRPPSSQLRPDASLNELRLAVFRALMVQMTGPGKWRELALLVDAESKIVHELRLADPAAAGEPDYDDRVHRAVPAVLGIRYQYLDCDGSEDDNEYEHLHEDIYLDQLALIEGHLDLPAWLAEHKPRLYRLLYGGALAETTAVDAVDEVVTQLALPEIPQQLVRLRRDLVDDLPAAIGHTKELVESACKTVLGETGADTGTMKFPRLVTAALRATGRHPTQLDSTDADTELLRRLLGGLSSQLEAIAGLRNRVGTGHGRGCDVVLDAPLARLVIGQSLVAVEYLLRVSDLQPDAGADQP